MIITSHLTWIWASACQVPRLGALLLISINSEAVRLVLNFVLLIEFNLKTIKVHSNFDYLCFWPKSCQPHRQYLLILEKCTSPLFFLPGDAKFIPWVFVELSHWWAYFLSYLMSFTKLPKSFLDTFCNGPYLEHLLCKSVSTTRWLADLSGSIQSWLYSYRCLLLGFSEWPSSKKVLSLCSVYYRIGSSYHISQNGVHRICCRFWKFWGCKYNWTPLARGSNTRFYRYVCCRFLGPCAIRLLTSEL